jgi:hypothetical protein
LKEAHREIKHRSWFLSTKKVISKGIFKFKQKGLY